MKRILRIALPLFIVCCAAVSCGGDGRVIPVAKMEKIYREMFLADQWLADNPDKQAMADTTWFYEPIFKKYGYTLKDYQNSVDRYLNDPKRYAEMLDRVEKGLRKDFASLNAELDLEDRLRYKADSIYRAMKSVQAKEFHSFMVDLDVDAMTDRVDIEIDSIGVYRLVPVVEDTVFHGPMLVIRDTAVVAVRDSVPARAVVTDVVEAKEVRRPAGRVPVALDKAGLKGGKIVKKDLLITE